MTRHHPDWLKVNIPGGKNYTAIITKLKKYSLNTVCAEARCPNLAECYGNGTATFLIMGKICMRNCRYCNIRHGIPLPLDPHEPVNIGKAVSELELSHVVITSVTRDDLPDGGALHFVRTVEAVRACSPHTTVELLLPDFKGSQASLRTVLEAGPDVAAHNIEVVCSLYPALRPQGNLECSLSVLKSIKQLSPATITKSSLMVGLGESLSQIKDALADLRKNEVDAVSIGQYLQPSTSHAKVFRYYPPEDFYKLKAYAINLGFRHVEASPLTRSSYHAERVLCT
jgi:lipoic acid synthetase